MVDGMVTFDLSGFTEKQQPTNFTAVHFPLLGRALQFVPGRVWGCTAAAKESQNPELLCGMQMLILVIL